MMYMVLCTIISSITYLRLKQQVISKAVRQKVGHDVIFYESIPDSLIFTARAVYKLTKHHPTEGKL